MTAEGNAGDIMVLTPVKKMQLKAEAAEAEAAKAEKEAARAVALGVAPEAAEAFVAFAAAVADAPEFVKCAITDEVMYDPVINALGYTYERKEIENWYIINNSDPLTGGPISDLTLRPNMFARQIIELWCKHNVRDGGDSYFTYAVAIRKKNDQTFGSLKEGECVRELQLVREQLAPCEAELRLVRELLAAHEAEGQTLRSLDLPPAVRRLHARGGVEVRDGVHLAAAKTPLINTFTDPRAVAAVETPLINTFAYT